MSALRGTGTLARLALRRDRLLLPWWTVVLGLLPVALGRAVEQLAPTAGQRLEYARLGQTGIGRALYGPLHDAGAGLGGLTAWRGGFVPVLLGLVSALTVIRHTRAEEELGRRELVGSAVVGRHAGLAAALLVTALANLGYAAAVTVSLAAWGRPLAGSLALGLCGAAAGWVFGAVGGVAAQLTDGASAARGLALGTLGATYLLRVVGDVAEGSASWLSWVSPLGWSHQVRPFAGERWWVLAAPVTVAAGVAGLAVALAARRDLGAGLVPGRPGRPGASAALGSPLGLAWRLQRTSLVSWTLGSAVIGGVLGGLAQSIGDLLGDNPSMRQVLERLGGRTGVVDSYLATSMGIVGLLAGAQAVQATLRMRAEESGQRVEPLLGTAVGRWRWTAGHLPFVLAGPGVSLAAAGVLAGWTYGARTGDVAGQVGRCLGGALLHLPAVWVLAGVAMAAFGLLPRLTVAAGWAAVTGCGVLMLFGAMLDLDPRVLDLSPFQHVPHYPGGAVPATPVLALLAVAAGLWAIGTAGLNRRDVPAE